jgi:7-cyano-7-deazaguanine synthase
MTKKAFVLLSGGIDSTTCLHAALVGGFDYVEAVSINYGQRQSKVLDFASKSCAALSIPHHTLDLSAIIPKTMLTDEQAKVPDVSYDELVGVSPTYVPFRNGLMLSALASFVHGKWVEECSNNDFPQIGLPEWAIYYGAHAEDSRNWAYPDCTPEFNGTLGAAIYIGTYKAIRLVVPLQWMTKAEIIRKGDSLGVDWSKTWSCYKGGEQHCGVCPTCRARREGFKAAEVFDPTEYAADPAN